MHHPPETTSSNAIHSESLPESESDGLQWLHNAIHEAAHLLPSQGPIGVFIHHNTLHAFEHQSFDHAVRTGHQVFGFEPYLSEDRYREELTRGRIHFSELNIVLERDLGQTAANSILGLATRLDLRIAMLQYPLRSGQDAELNWFMAETESLHRMRQDVSEVHRRRFVNDTRNWIMRRVRGSSSELIRPAWLNGLLIRFEEMHIESWSDADWEAFTLNALWEVCLAGVQQSVDPTGALKPIHRHRDLLVSLGGLDSDQLVDDVLIRMCAVFLDQGIGHWEMPGREIGLYDAFCALYERGSIGDAWWLSGLSSELKRLKSLRVGPLASIHESLQALGVSHDETLAYLSSTLLALRGWAGMIWHVEERADRVHHGIPPGSLIDFLAVRLILEQFALRVCARDTLGYTEKLSELRTVLGASLTPNAPNRDKPRAYAIFQLAQILGWTPERLFLLESHEWRILLDEVEGFGKLDRRRIFHLAYEHRFRVQTLNALAVHSASRSTPAERPTFQAVFCIDEREESIRRHVEEVAPTAETFGVAGFFGVIMYYRGAAAADFVPLCPVVVRPQHWVSETVDLSLLASHERRRITRRRVGMTLQAFHGGSRRIVSGAFLSATIGLLATIPLVAHVMFPRLTARFQKFFGRFISPPPKTRLLLERSTPKSSPIEDEHGFLLSEMIDMMERLLRDMGLTSRFSRLVFLIGHGSTSMNNPHESAHDCGACGGGVGGPNARAAAHMLNDPRVRKAIQERGIVIPDDTVFVGGLHNTSKDDLTFADVDRVPDSHRNELEVACAALHEACFRNAHERARRFGSASLTMSPATAKRHMEGRAEDLSQVRPEWGHATNAICIVGRRAKTRGLFLDRRAFLVSYDSTQDDAEHTILARILGAVVPVCSGINLEYYFSYVDSPGWGSGSKLPHNITGLLGVMDGAMSDLRTGLPWQMVEVHEPVRLLFVIEATVDTCLSILERNAAIKTMVANAWVQLALMDPTTGQISVYANGTFEPHEGDGLPLPLARSSAEWYSGWREPLEFAEILTSRPSV